MAAHCNQWGNMLRMATTDVVSHVVNNDTCCNRWDYKLQAAMADAWISGMTCYERRGKTLWPLRWHAGTGNGRSCDQWDGVLQAVGLHATRVVAMTADVVTVEETCCNRQRRMLRPVGWRAARLRFVYWLNQTLMEKRKKQKYSHEFPRKINGIGVRCDIYIDNSHLDENQHLEMRMGKSD